MNTLYTLVTIGSTEGCARWSVFLPPHREAVRREGKSAIPVLQLSG